MTRNQNHEHWNINHHCAKITTESKFDQKYSYLQYRHLISAPIDRMSASARLYKHPWITTWQKIRQTHQWHTLLANQSYIQLWVHPCPGNWVAIRRAVVYYAQAVHAFSAGSVCQHWIMFHLCWSYFIKGTLGIPNVASDVPLMTPGGALPAVFGVRPDWWGKAPVTTGALWGTAFIAFDVWARGGH